MAEISHKYISSLKQEGKVENHRFYKKVVLDFLFRNLCFIDEQNNIKEFSKEDLDKIGMETNLSNQKIISIINQFLMNVRNLKGFFDLKPINWEYDIAKLTKKVRLYLHKLYRIAPIFSYNRAKENLNKLHLLLGQKNHWPHITTQMALVLFITDRNDRNIKKNRYIMQKNLRAFCSCSAYAFHHARNILRINRWGELY